MKDENDSEKSILGQQSPDKHPEAGFNQPPLTDSASHPGEWQSEDDGSSYTVTLLNENTSDKPTRSSYTSEGWSRYPYRPDYKKDIDFDRYIVPLDKYVEHLEFPLKKAEEKKANIKKWPDLMEKETDQMKKVSKAKVD